MVRTWFIGIHIVQSVQSQHLEKGRESEPFKKISINEISFLSFSDCPVVSVFHLSLSLLSQCFKQASIISNDNLLSLFVFLCNDHHHCHDNLVDAWADFKFSMNPPSMVAAACMLTAIMGLKTSPSSSSSSSCRSGSQWQLQQAIQLRLNQITGIEVVGSRVFTREKTTKWQSVREGEKVIVSLHCLHCLSINWRESRRKRVESCSLCPFNAYLPA